MPAGMGRRRRQKRQRHQESLKRPPLHCPSSPSLPFSEAFQPLRSAVGGMPHHIEAGVDEVNLARDAAREIAKQVKCRSADMVELDVFLERAVGLVPFEDSARIADGRTRQGAHRPGRDRVDADAVAPEIGGEVAHGRLERGFRHPHHIVVRHDAVGAQIAQRHQRAAIAALRRRRHQMRGALRHRGEGKAGNVERTREIGAAGVDIAPRQLVLVGKGDGVDEEIEPVPFLLQGGERCVELVVLLDVARQHQRGIAGDQTAQPLGLRLALIGEGELGGPGPSACARCPRRWSGRWRPPITRPRLPFISAPFSAMCLSRSGTARKPPCFVIHASYRWNTSEALVPPKPKLFDMAVRIFRVVDALAHDVWRRRPRDRSPRYWRSRR